jgi:glycosyltransferase involved in cell wall biosynthesis
MPLGSPQGMSANHEVSVVMSAYNSGSDLAATINSVLSQKGVELEFIVVNDGSTDETGKILDDYARRDGRLRIIHQEHTGLTRALIRGCAAATGEFIARQDAGDISLPGRLAVQVDVLRNNPAVVMTSCGSRFTGPDHEVLYEVCQVGEELQRGLQHVSIHCIKGPSHHTSVMFRRKAFERVGGYRAQFKVAQDLDLWMRLSEMGICWATPDVLCEVRVSKSSISATRRREQLRTAKIILECAATRRTGREDLTLVENFDKKRSWRESFYWTPRRLHEARFYYFVGSMLQHRRPEQAGRYFWRAVGAWFAYPRAWYSILWASTLR